MRLAATLTAAAVLALAPEAARGAGSAALFPIEQTGIPSPAGPGSRAAVFSADRDGGVWLAWIEVPQPLPPPAAAAAPVVRCAHFDPASGRWGSPRVIASATGWTDGDDSPAITASAKGHLAAAWTVRQPGPTVLVSQSDDEGATWSPPLPLSKESRSAGQVSLATLQDGRVLAAWLDARSAGKTALFLRFLSGPMTIAPDYAFDPSVSEGCQPQMAELLDGGAVLLYRAIADEGARDIAIARLHGRRWEDRHVLSPDNWIPHGAPSPAQVAGPAIAADGSRLAAAWFTGADEDPRLLYSSSSDAGTRFLMPIRLADGIGSGRPSVALIHDGAALVSWVAPAAGSATGEVRLCRVSPELEAGAPITLGVPASGCPAASPRLALVSDFTGGHAKPRAIVAYTAPGPVVRTVAVTVPERQLLEAANTNCNCGATPEQLLGYPISGSIVSLSPDFGTLVIETGLIPGLLEPGQHVFFASRDQMRPLKEGSQCLARVERRDGSWWLYDVKLLAEAL